MGAYYWKVWLEAWHSALAAGSSTGYSMLVLSIGAAIISSALTVFVEWIRGGRTMNSFISVRKQWPTYIIPPATIIVLWVGTVCWKLLGAPVRLDGALVSERNAAILDRDFWKRKFEASDALGKAPLPTAKASSPWRWEPAKPVTVQPNDGLGTAAVMITAKGTVTDLRFDVSCDAPCKAVPNESYQFPRYMGIGLQQSSPTDNPKLVHLRVSMPGILALGDQLDILFVANDRTKPLAITSVSTPR